MRVTLKQIAEKAGVHRSTIDKVLHDREGVSDEVRDRIQKLLVEMQYEPNAIGKALAQQKKPKLIIISLLKVDSLDEIKEGIERAYSEVESFGLRIEYQVSSVANYTEQAENLRLLLKRKFDGLIVAPIRNPLITEEINKLVEKGIPVITVNTDLPESRRTCFIGQDSVRAGRVAGQLMGEILNGRGKVAIITGSTLMLNPTERLQGFNEVVSEHYPGIEVVEEIETKEIALITFQKVIDVVNRYDDLSGMVITCGQVNELGKAVRMLNKSKKIKIISYDLYPEIKKLVEDGTINFTICQNLVSQGFRSLKTMFEIVFNNTYPNNQVMNSEIDIRIRENINL